MTSVGLYATITAPGLETGTLPWHWGPPETCNALTVFVDVEDDARIRQLAARESVTMSFSPGGVQRVARLLPEGGTRMRVNWLDRLGSYGVPAPVDDPDPVSVGRRRTLRTVLRGSR